MSKRAFTLIEMLLVLSIIGILFLFMRPLFDNTSTQEPKDCLQSLYQEMNHFVFEGLNPQSIRSGGRDIRPDTYIVDISTGIIEYFQEYSGQLVWQDTRSLNTHADVCSIANTELLLSWSTTQFQINNQTITITTPPTHTFTGAIELRQCFPSTGCDYIGQMIIDTRTQRLYIPSPW